MKGKLGGQTVVCIASGPSLNKTDIKLVRRSKLITIAVNNAWKWAPWADLHYAGDMAWWRNYGAEVRHKSQRWTCSKAAAERFRCKYRPRKIKPGYNSGAMAIELALHLGAARVLMIGYDCSVANGTHFDGDHSKTPNPTPERCKRWKPQFKQILKLYPNAEVINCSRYTELKCFPRKTLEEALACREPGSIYAIQSHDGEEILQPA